MGEDESGCGEPIACTLGADQWTERIAEWQMFRRTSVLRAEGADGAVRLHLVPSDDALLAAASLSQREKACCAFFEFTIQIGVADAWLVVQVPDGADATLASFVTMLEAG